MPRCGIVIFFHSHIEHILKRCTTLYLEISRSVTSKQLATRMAQTKAENTEVDIEDTEVKTEEDKKDVLGERIGHMTITVGKPKPYVHGDNFYQFCNNLDD